MFKTLKLSSKIFIGIALVLFVLAVIGFLLPMLISAKSGIAVILGITIIVLMISFATGFVITHFSKGNKNAE